MDSDMSQEPTNMIDQSQIEQAVSERLHDCFAGFGLGPCERRDQLVDDLVQRTSTRWAEQPEADAAALAVEIAEADLDAWLTHVLGSAVLGEQPPLLAGRAACWSCAPRWPDLLLVHDDLPSAFVEAMRAALPVVTPPPLPAAMVEQPYDSWSLFDLAAAWLGGEPENGVAVVRQDDVAT